MSLVERCSASAPCSAALRAWACSSALARAASMSAKSDSAFGSETRRFAERRRRVRRAGVDSSDVVRRGSVELEVSGLDSGAPESVSSTAVSLFRARVLVFSCAAVAEREARRPAGGRGKSSASVAGVVSLPVPVVTCSSASADPVCSGVATSSWGLAVVMAREPVPRLLDLDVEWRRARRVGADFSVSLVLDPSEVALVDSDCSPPRSPSGRSSAVESPEPDSWSLTGWTGSCS